MSCLGCLNHRGWGCSVEVMLLVGLKEEILVPAKQDWECILTGMGVTKEVTK